MLSSLIGNFCRLPVPGVVAPTTRPRETCLTHPQQPADEPSPRIPDYPFMVPEPAPGSALIRMVQHPDQLNPLGISITCASCRAERDWLLLETRRRVFVRCRCGHEWEEADLEAEFFDENFAYADRSWDNAGQALKDLGFNGEFAGIYFN